MRGGIGGNGGCDFGHDERRHEAGDERADAVDDKVGGTDTGDSRAVCRDVCRRGVCRGTIDKGRRRRRRFPVIYHVA